MFGKCVGIVVSLVGHVCFSTIVINEAPTTCSMRCYGSWVGKTVSAYEYFQTCSTSL